MALAVVHVGGTTASVGSGSTATSDSWTSTTGSLIVVVLTVYNTGTGPDNGDVTDSKSNSYTYVTSSGSFGGASVSGVACYINDGGTRGTTHTVSSNLVGSAGESKNVHVIEFTGHLTPNPVDSTTTATANDTTSPFTVTAAAAVAAGAAGVYGCSIGGDTGNPAFTDPTGYTPAGGNQNDASTSLVGYVGYKLSESGTPAPAVTWTGTVSQSPRETFISIKSAAVATVPGAPTSLSTTPGSTQMGLSWTAPADDGGSALTDYIVQYRVTP